MIPLLLLAAAVASLPLTPCGPNRLARLCPAPEPDPVDPAPDRRPTLAGVAVGLLVLAVIGGWYGLGLGLFGAVGAGVLVRATLSRPQRGPADPLALAAGWDLLAACLRAGLAVPAAVTVVAGHLPDGLGAELRAVAEHLALGAPPRVAWAAVPSSSPLRKVARAAQRSADSGAALAGVAARAAADVRAGARDGAAARAQRTSVLITGPLGLCFLPAFLALGVAPVIIGMASAVARSW